MIQSSLQTVSMHRYAINRFLLNSKKRPNLVSKQCIRWKDRKVIREMFKHLFACKGTRLVSKKYFPNSKKNEVV